MKVFLGVTSNSNSTFHTSGMLTERYVPTNSSAIRLIRQANSMLVPHLAVQQT